MSADLTTVVSAFARLTSASIVNDVHRRDRSGAEQLVRAAAVVNGLVESVRLRAVARLHDLADAGGGFDPDQQTAAAGRTSRRSAARSGKRAATARQFPQLGAALERGDVSGEHLDAVAQAMAKLDPAERELLAVEADWIQRVAERCTPDDLAAALRRKIGELMQARAVDLLERQKRAVTARTWTDRDTGMVHLRAELDPEAGAAVIAALRRRGDSLFRERVPDTCPTDERKHDHLTGLSLIDLLTRPRQPAAGAMCSCPVGELVVIIDADTLVNGAHAGSRVEVVGGVTLPVEAIQRRACLAAMVPVVMGADGVPLYVGRTYRLATPAQRRALQAMQATCSFPGCSVPADRCTPHHIKRWNWYGPTDLDNLTLLCSRHHHLVHEGRWRLERDPTTWNLTFTSPDGVQHERPPPFAVAV